MWLLSFTVTDKVTFLEPSIDTEPVVSPPNVKVNAFSNLDAVFTSTFIVTSLLPSNETEPVASPLKLISTGVCNLEAVSALPFKSPVISALIIAGNFKLTLLPPFTLTGIGVPDPSELTIPTFLAVPH